MLPYCHFLAFDQCVCRRFLSHFEMFGRISPDPSWLHLDIFQWWFFFFSVWGKWSRKKKRKKLSIYCYLCSLIQQDGREWFELMCLMEKLTSCWILVESCFNGIWPSSWVWINTTQNGNLINSKYVLNSLLKGTLEQNKCIWYKPH